MRGDEGPERTAQTVNPPKTAWQSEALAGVVLNEAVQLGGGVGGDALLEEGAVVFRQGAHRHVVNLIGGPGIAPENRQFPLVFPQGVGGGGGFVGRGGGAGCPVRGGAWGRLSLFSVTLGSPNIPFLSKKVGFVRLTIEGIWKFCEYSEKNTLFQYTNGTEGAILIKYGKAALVEAKAGQARKELRAGQGRRALRNFFFLGTQGEKEVFHRWHFKASRAGTSAPNTGRWPFSNGFLPFWARQFSL